MEGQQGRNHKSSYPHSLSLQDSSSPCLTPLNMHHSFFCQQGVHDGAVHVFPQVHRPPQSTGVSERAGFQFIVVLWKDKQLERVTGTNQNICLLLQTVQLSLISTLSLKTPGNRLQFSSQLNKGTFRLKLQVQSLLQQVQ